VDVCSTSRGGADQQCRRSRSGSFGATGFAPSGDLAAYQFWLSVHWGESVCLADADGGDFLEGSVPKCLGLPQSSLCRDSVQSAHAIFPNRNPSKVALWRLTMSLFPWSKRLPRDGYRPSRIRYIDFSGHIPVFGAQSLKDLLHWYEKFGGKIWEHIFEQSVERHSASPLNYAIFAIRTNEDEHINAAKGQLGLL
jgi:hypothetical protein